MEFNLSKQKQDLLVGDQYEEQQYHKINRHSSRPQYIGPWVENAMFFKTKTKINKQQTQKFHQQENDEIKKRTQFLIHLQQQAQEKRRRFRNLIGKAQIIQNLGEYEQENKNINKIQKKQQFNTSLYQQNKPTQNKSKIKKVLSTTMYVYQLQQNKNSPRRKNTKTLCFASGSSAKKNQSSEQKVHNIQQNQIKHGSKNLQKILKMKEKIRQKNSYLVKKIKQQKTTINQQNEQNSLQRLNLFMPYWNSTIVTSQIKKGKKQFARNKTVQYNQNIHELPLKIKRSITTKFFNELNQKV